ncbi:GatB/YqeY domain-containing protein [Paenibacillus alvei]|uniref:GatB/YqeY domain-containing protein n=1 Tax=Paenibacillus alvei TaxID=44250 RepID=UPI00228211F3|nr:GatB/YqeY domain-containing protein [Paenibacillus alvei]MCY9737491.1 GatB/YqeY domain-containing protein [Paenibacillus alvei]
MNIKDNLSRDMKLALKHDKLALSTIRMIVDRIQKKEKELNKDLTESEIVEVLQSFKKQTNEEIDAFARANNAERVNKLHYDIQVIDTYLPRQMTGDEIYEVVNQVIEDLKSEGHAIYKGMVMKNVMPLVKGKADNSLVNRIVTELTS